MEHGSILNGNIRPRRVSSQWQSTLREVYLRLHPRSADKWDAAVGLAGGAQAVAIQKLFETTRKGDFAQLVADEINIGKAFNVPDYLQSAIKALVK